MPTYIAPGVYSEELDLSLYVPSLSSAIYGIVGGFKKGPVNIVTPITTRTQFEQVFGTPLRGDVGFAAHSALHFLRFGHQLRVVRVVDSMFAVATDNLRSDDSAMTVVGTVAGVSPGDWANGFHILITERLVPSVADPLVNELIFTLNVYAIGAGTVTSPFVFNFTGVAALEVWTDVVFNDPVNPRFVEKVINGNSLYINVTMSAPNADVETERVYTLAGGNDGTMFLGDSDIIGTVDSNGIHKGLQAFDDPLLVDISLLSCPGFNHHRVVALEMITICESRRDCFAVLDVPDTTNTAQKEADYVLGSLGTPANPYFAFAPLPSTNYAGIYGPWIKVFDAYGKEEVLMPPTARVMGNYAFNDSVAYPWFAVAGPNRGILQDTLDVLFKLSVGDVENTYGFGVNINPIQTTIDGIVINGNKTLQRKPSLLQNIHVRRMLLAIEKALAAATRYLLWEPHDPQTWRAYVNLVDPFIRDIVVKRGITDFRVKCDSETNTPYYINLGQLVAEIHLIPTNAVAIIVNRYIIHPAGISLSSSTAVA